MGILYSVKFIGLLSDFTAATRTIPESWLLGFSLLQEQFLLSLLPYPSFTHSICDPFFMYIVFVFIVPCLYYLMTTFLVGSRYTYIIHLNSSFISLPFTVVSLSTFQSSSPLKKIFPLVCLNHPPWVTAWTRLTWVPPMTVPPLSSNFHLNQPKTYLYVTI